MHDQHYREWRANHRTVEVFRAFRSWAEERKRIGMEGAFLSALSPDENHREQMAYLRGLYDAVQALTDMPWEELFDDESEDGRSIGLPGSGERPEG